MTPDLPEASAPGGCAAPTGSALDLALALLAVSPARGRESLPWVQAGMALSPHCRENENVTEAALRIVAESREWYRRRVALLGRAQKHMRDPERTLVCDILANGQLLPDPNGERYGFPTTGNEHAQNAIAVAPPTQDSNEEAK